MALSSRPAQPRALLVGAGVLVFAAGCAPGAEQRFELMLLLVALGPILLSQMIACAVSWSRPRPLWSLIPVVLLMIIGGVGGVMALSILQETPLSVRENVAIHNYSLPAIACTTIVSLGIAALGNAWEKTPSTPHYLDADLFPPKPRDSMPWVIAASALCTLLLILGAVALCSEQAQLR